MECPRKCFSLIVPVMLDETLSMIEEAGWFMNFEIKDSNVGWWIVIQKTWFHISFWTLIPVKGEKSKAGKQKWYVLADCHGSTCRPQQHLGAWWLSLRIELLQQLFHASSRSTVIRFSWSILSHESQVSNWINQQYNRLSCLFEAFFPNLLLSIITLALGPHLLFYLFHRIEVSYCLVTCCRFWN